MPYLAGGTLRDRLRGAPAPFALGAAWIRQLGGRARRRARGGRPAPRREARERPPRQGRPALPRGLRDREDGRDADGPHGDGRRRRDARLHGARAGAGPAREPGDGPICPRRRRVRDPLGPSAVRRRQPALPHAPARHDAAARALVARRRAAGGPRRRPRPRALEGSRRRPADVPRARGRDRRFLPTGFLPAAAPAPGAAPSSATAPTVLQPRGGTPPPVARDTFAAADGADDAAAPRARERRDAVALAHERRDGPHGRSAKRRRLLAWAVGAAAVVFIGLSIAGKARRDAERAGCPADAGARPPRLPSRRPSAAAPAPDGRAEQEPKLFAQAGEAHRRPREAREGRRGRRARGSARPRPRRRPAPRSRPPAPEPRETPSAPPPAGERAPHAALAAARERLDVLRRSRTAGSRRTTSSSRSTRPGASPPSIRRIPSRAISPRTPRAASRTSPETTRSRARSPWRRSWRSSGRASRTIAALQQLVMHPTARSSRRAAGSSRSPTATRAARRWPSRRGRPREPARRARPARPGDAPKAARARAGRPGAAAGDAGARLDRAGRVAYLPVLLSGTSSVVERYLAKVDVASSTLVSRSNSRSGPAKAGPFSCPPRARQAENSA